MSYKINFDNLTATEFENFCFDLLKELKFKDLNWRKGTGKSFSPADGGRDIECNYIRVDYLLGETSVEKWFVECKHYIKGVPADKLLGILTSAISMDINRCVIIVSNFLSNSAKDMINNFIEKNKPRFKISVWERPKLEVLTKNMNSLLRKHNIIYRDDILDYINPYHIEYIKTDPYNKLNAFFKYFNRLDGNTRDRIVDFLALKYLKDFFSPEVTIYSNRDNTYNELLKTFNKISNITSEDVVVSSITSTVLNYYLSSGNPSSIEPEIIEIENYLKNEHYAIGFAYAKSYEYGYEHEDDEYIITQGKKAFEEFIQVKISGVEPSKRMHYSIYNEFCDIVLKNLIYDDKSVKEI